MNRHLLARTVLALFICGASTAVHADEAADGKVVTYSPAQLQQRNIERRAIEALTWGMPAVNFQLMLDGFRKLGGGPNQVIYWSRPVNGQNQSLTPNPDTIYVTPFYDTRNGPVVLEIPPADNGNFTGSIDDGWQNALADVGPEGTDQGKGGKYLILPPGYKGDVPAGYIVRKSNTFQGFALLRSNLKNGRDEDIANAVAYGKRIKFYPLNAPSETIFIDAYNKPYDATIPYNASFFEALDRFVQVEPWLERDRARIDTLASLGIVKGKANTLSANTPLLDKAAQEAKPLVALWTEQALALPFFAGTQWALPVSQILVDGMGDNFPLPESYPIDGRAVMYSLGYFSAKRLGAGQFYLMTIKDKEGRKLDGSKLYRLHVPAHPPVKLYWSVTAYNGETHALLRDTRWQSRGSNTPGLQKNDDGSVDIYFGANPPAGKESNWVPTSADGRFELLFRLYGPEKAFFDKVWQLPDLLLQQ